MFVRIMVLLLVYFYQLIEQHLMFEILIHLVVVNS